MQHALLLNPFNLNQESPRPSRIVSRAASRATPVCSSCQSDDVIISRATVQWSNESQSLGIGRHVRPADALQQLQQRVRHHLAAAQLASSAQVGAKIAHAPSQALPQQRSQRCAVDVTDLGGDGIDIEAAAVEQRSRAFDAQVLEIGQRRFAEHRFAAALQRARAGRQRSRGFLQREACP